MLACLLSGFGFVFSVVCFVFVCVLVGFVVVKPTVRALQIIQTNQINLPLLPTTTIGSFPQTKEVRKYRADFKAGKITDAEYKKFLQEETTRCIQIQEEIGLDAEVPTPDGEEDIDAEMDANVEPAGLGRERR